ncbi:MAG: hypothetical protein KA764_04045, partial [Anaerolineales bacterium]|nr:hypothetical protein [Anaerolineales bacterium]
MAAELVVAINSLDNLAKTLGVPKRKLKQALKASTINGMDSQAVAAPTAASPSTQEMSSADDRPSREQFTHLVGVGITLSEAAKKYDVPRHRVHHWAVERGYVKCVDNGYPAKYDEGDIAFVVAVVHYREKAGITDTA